MSTTFRQGGDYGELSGRHGFMYFPSYAYNTFQTWRFYDSDQIEREMDMAQSVGVDFVRVFLSYEYWRNRATNNEPGNKFLRDFDHFLDTCHARNIQVMPVLFESIGDEPDPQTFHNRDINTAFAVRSPSTFTIGLRDWTGQWSPMHFTRRITNFVEGDPAVLAIEAMNEPGNEDGAPNRIDFVRAMIRAVREEDPTQNVTVGCKTVENNLQYDDLDIFQYHQNLPVDSGHFAQTMVDARDVADAHGKPLWNTEIQRYRGRDHEPPSRFLPNYANIYGDIHEYLDQGSLDGACFWGLMLKPAYIETPRERGRINGVFHPDGSAFWKPDAEAIAGDDLPHLNQNPALSQEWVESRFPFPDPVHEFDIEEPPGDGEPSPPPEDGGSNSNAALWIIGAGLGATILLAGGKKDK